MVPSIAHTTQPVSIEIRGDHFNLVGERNLARGTGLDASFHAALGGVPLTDVRWVDNHTLAATVPAGLSGDPLDLVLDGPTGRGVLPAAFRATPAPAAALAVTVAPPRQVALSQQFQVSVTIANTGGTAASHVRPSLSGAGISVAPLDSDLTIDAGQSTTLVFVASSSARGPATFAAAATGADAFTGDPVTAQGAGGSTVFAPAALRATPHPLPATMTVGKQFTLTVDVTNDGDVDANAVSMVDPQADGTGRVDDVGSAPFTQAIPAGQTRTFAWTYLAAAPGDLVLGCSGTGIDGLTFAPLAVSASWRQIQILTPASLSSTVSAPASLSVGDQAWLELDVTNSGDSLAAAVVPSLTIGGSAIAVLSSTGAQDIPGHETRIFRWQLSAVSAGSTTLALQARGSDANSGAAVSTAPPFQPTITVQTPAQITARASAPARVSTGQSFPVSIEVSDLGDAAAGTVSATIACTPADLLSQSATPNPAPVGGHQTQTFAWTFAAVSAGTVNCTLTASGADVNDGHAVSATQTVSIQVQRAAVLEVIRFSVPATVSRGQSFSATLVVANTGGATARGVVVSPDPPQVIAVGQASATASPSAGGQDIPAGGNASFTFTFVENGRGTGSLVLHAGAFGADANSGLATSAVAVDSRGIGVQAPASLLVTRVSVPVPPSIDRGETFPVSVEITNTGGATAVDVLPSPLPLSMTRTGGASATTSTFESAAVIAPGDKATFDFAYVENGTSAGSVVFSASASGTDANSGEPLLAAALPSAALAVQDPPLLVVSKVSVPAAVSRGQVFAVSATVVNNGGATARCVRPNPDSLSVTMVGAASVQLGSMSVTTAPIPGLQGTCPPGISGPDLAAGQSATFSWTATENGTGSGSLRFDGTATGTDANTSAVLSTTPVSATTNVMTPPLLSVVVRAGPSSITRTQRFTTTVVVTNQGEATALNVSPVISPSTFPAAGGGASAITTSSPPAVAIASGGTASFVYDFMENGTSSGTLRFFAGASGTDANSTTTVSAPDVASPVVTVLDKTQLLIESFSIPATLSRGQAFNLSLRVTNVSSGTLADVAPSPNPPDQNTTGFASASVAARPLVPLLAPGASATFTYPAVESGTGTGTLAFSGTVSAIDVATSLPVSANQTSTGTAVVEKPAALAIRSFSVPPTLSRGQTFTATLVVANTGEAAGLGVLPDPVALSASGLAHATVKAAPAAQDIGAGETATFGFALVEDGTGPGSLQLGAKARGSDVNSGAQVASTLATTGTTVQEPGHLTVSQMSVPATISRGQSFTVSVTVTNDGGATVQGIAQDSSSPSVTVGGSAAMPVLETATPGKSRLDAGQSTTFFWTYQDASTSSGNLAFAATIAGSDVNSGVPLAVAAAPATTTVQNPAVLSVTSLTLAPAAATGSIDRGQSFAVTLVVANTGGATATNVLPSPSIPAVLATGQASASSPTGQVAVSIAGGSSQTFTWMYVENGTGPGALQVSAGAVGSDANSGDPLTAAAATSNLLTVVSPPVLSAQSFTLPSRLSRGQTFTASLIIANTGGSAAASVLPEPPVLAATGGAHATATSSPVAATIAAGASAPFTWTYVEDGTAAGTIALATRASGTDTNTASPVVSGSISTDAVPVLEPASLVITVVSLLGPSGAPTIDPGQAAAATMTVKNAGGSAALGVALSPPVLTATGGANAIVSAPPAAQDIAAGQSATYTVSLTENGSGSGTLQISFGAAGTDASSNLPVSASAVSSNVLQVKAPAALAGALIAPPAALPGETFTVS
ncbi:MAG: beta strand repeat-containing protein, partial [Myxococcales bacterium]